MLLVVAWPRFVRAQAPEPVLLEWNAPAGCSGARDILSRVRQLSQAEPLSDKQLRVVATVWPIERARLHLRLVLRAGDLRGERNIDGQTCEDLAGATAVVLALLLRSAAPLSDDALDGQQASASRAKGAAQAGTTSGDEAAATALVSPSSSEIAQPAQLPAARDPGDERTRRRWRAILQLPLVALGLGPVPGPSVGTAVAGGTKLELWSLLAEGAVWSQQTVRSRDQPDSATRVRRIEAALRGCRALPLGRFELAPCLRVSLQHVWARGTGTRVSARTAGASWLAVAAGLQARYRVSPWFRVFAGVDANVEAARPRISIDELGELGQLRAFAFTLTLGPEWIL